MRLVREREFDVLVLDLSMPGRSGMELIKLVKAERPGCGSSCSACTRRSQYAVRAIKSGASGYLTKESAPAQLVQAIQKIAGGRRLHQRRGGRAAGAGRHARQREAAA